MLFVAILCYSMLIYAIRLAGSHRCRWSHLGPRPLVPAIPMRLLVAMTVTMAAMTMMAIIVLELPPKSRPTPSAEVPGSASTIHGMGADKLASMNSLQLRTLANQTRT